VRFQQGFAIVAGWRRNTGNGVGSRDLKRRVEDEQRAIALEDAFNVMNCRIGWSPLTCAV
jgi:hypothetical protein